MSTYREKLPQLGDRLFITDGGLETTLYFDKESVALHVVLPRINIFGGCCGTDVRHLSAIYSHLSRCIVTA